MASVSELGLSNPEVSPSVNPSNGIRTFAERLEERRQLMLKELPRYEIQKDQWYKDVGIYKDELHPQFVCLTKDAGIWEVTVVDPLGVYTTNHFRRLQQYNSIVSEFRQRQNFTKPDDKNPSDFKHRSVQYFLYANFKTLFGENIFAPIREDDPDDIDNTSTDDILIEVSLEQIGQIDLFGATDGKRFHIVEIGSRNKHDQAENYALGVRRRYGIPSDRITWTAAHYGEVTPKGGEVVLIPQNGHKYSMNNHYPKYQ